MRSFYFLCLFFFFSFHLSAQSPSCGTAPPSEEMIKDMVFNVLPFENTYAQAENTPTCLPVKVHIVRFDNGNGGFSPNLLSQAFANLNRSFINSNIQFFVCGDVNFIDNTDFYNYDTNEPDNDDDDDFLAGEYADNAINLIIASSLTVTVGGEPFSAAGFARFPTNNDRTNRIFMKGTSMLNDPAGTLAHEFGHYFWLFHTHRNTEFGNDDPDAERVVRTGPNANCSSKGDLLCDTDADPRYNSAEFSFSTCQYTGSDTDDLGVPYQPLSAISNIMSYYPDQCVEGFTPGQFTRMQTGLNTRLGHTAYNLNCTADFIPPPNLTINLIPGQALLEWVDNTTEDLGYIVEQSTTSASSGFVPLEDGGVVPSSNSFSVSIANNTDYWFRIRPVNGDCDSYSNVVSTDTNNNDCSENINGYSFLGEYNDSKYFLSNNATTWTTARNNAQAAGGHLVSINTQSENNKIFNWINGIVFIGLNDINSEGTPAWQNSDPFTFNTINDVNSSSRDYGKMNNWNGNWGWDNASTTFKSVMEIPCDDVGCPCPSVYDPVCGSDGVTYSNSCEAECAGIFNYTNGECSSGGDCPNSLSGFTTLGEYGDSKYYLSNTAARPTDAQDNATSLGGYLVTISSSGENNFIQQNISEMVYIGLNDQDSEGDLKWFNGEPLTYNNVDPCGFCDANSSSKDFVIMAPWNGTWSFSNFYNQRKYVVEIPCEGGGGGNQPDLTLSNLENVASSMSPGQIQYFEFDLKNIGLATATNSYIIGMYISSDQNLSSNDILAGEVPTGNTFVGTDSNVPGGITVPSVSSGTYYLIVKADIENNISESNENNNTITSGPINIGSGGGGGCSGSTSISGFSYIGEYNNSRYYFSNSSARPTDAQSTCQSNGGYLASITSQGENNFIKQGISGLTYIGLNDEDSEGSVKWYSGESVGYTNFDDCSFCTSNSSNQDYGVMASWNGGWSWSNFWNKRRFVMEIPCSSSNTLITFPNFENRELEFLSLVPNPAFDFIGVQIKASNKADIDIQIFDARGVMVQSIEHQLFEGQNGLDLDISNLSGGMYWIRIPQISQHHSTKRFVKVND